MPTFKSIFATLCLLSCALMGACSSAEEEVALPVLNDENCHPDRVAQMKNKKAQSAFATKCAARSTYEPSKPRTW